MRIGRSKSLKDLGDLTIGAPDEDSITSWMMRATLRDSLGASNKSKFLCTRYQDAVPFFVEHGFAKAGATAATPIVKAWQDKGGRILGTSRPVPIKHLLAGPSLDADQVQRLRAYFIGLDTTDEGRKKLEPTKYSGFAPDAEADMMAIAKWLGL